MQTTVGQLLVNEILPEQYRDYGRSMGASEAKAVLTRMALENPERYKEVSNKLVMLGAQSSFDEGITLSISDTLSPVKDKKEVLDHLRQQKALVMQSNASDEEKEKAIEALNDKIRVYFTDSTYNAGLKAQNPFALQVASKARGSPAQLVSLQTSPGTYTDTHGKQIPIFIEHSFAEGLSPHEYWAGTYGARKSVISTKFATRDAGALGKQYNRAVMRLVVADNDCGTNAGIPVKPDDVDNIGSVLSSDAPPYKAGTVITKEVLQDLKDKYDEILVRSPLTCGCREGLCAKCAGIRETGKFPEIGSHVGLQASSALAERIAQGSLNVKHSSGVSQGKGKTDDGDSYAGFDVIDQLFQIPKEFPHRAAVASVTGNVESIEKAPQGGWNIVIDGKKHYALSETQPRCKVGDYVEAGDQLSTGLMNPADVVRYKGIGEGRRYLMNRATKAYKDSGYAVNRRNMEVLVRGFLDNVRIGGNEGVGDFLPDDVVSYSAMASTYRPRPDSAMRTVKDSIGSYLEEPVMHYTIGTKITRNVAKQLQRHGHSNIYVNANPPGFEPEATPLKLISRNEKDWVDRLGGTYLKSNILDAAHRGATSEIHSLQPEHAMARGIELGNPPPASQFGKKWVY
jgi:DNA-directed RNA polymerase subunit beta'